MSAREYKPVGLAVGVRLKLAIEEVDSAAERRGRLGEDGLARMEEQRRVEREQAKGVLKPSL